jgi:hypothetical protein
MSQTKVKVGRNKCGRRSVIKPTAEEIAAFAPQANGYFPIQEEVEAFMRHVTMVSAKDYPYSSLPGYFRRNSKARSPRSVMR